MRRSGGRRAVLAHRQRPEDHDDQDGPQQRGPYRVLHLIFAGRVGVWAEQQGRQPPLLGLGQLNCRSPNGDRSRPVLPCWSLTSPPNPAPSATVPVSLRHDTSAVQEAARIPERGRNGTFTSEWAAHQLREISIDAIKPRWANNPWRVTALMQLTVLSSKDDLAPGDTGRLRGSAECRESENLPINPNPYGAE